VTYLIGPQDIKLYFGFDPQPTETDAPAIRTATYHGQAKSRYICLSVTKSNVTLETTLHSYRKHL